MKSTESSTYVADYFLRILPVYLTLKEHIEYIHLRKYEYNNFGRTYIGLNVELIMRTDVELSEEDINTYKYFDDTLEVYVGKIDNLPSHLRENEKSQANKDIANVNKLIQGVCTKVLRKSEPFEDTEELTTYEGLVMAKEFKKFDNMFSDRETSKND